MTSSFGPEPKKISIPEEEEEESQVTLFICKDTLLLMTFYY